ncbi:MAG TPA: tRNA (N6-threonylcarbamoyladenosine(37)-N6)-methyltransferase TrmO [Vicinamibacterales bacterium]|jgi:tRNA-Thr(GGU) m(6)t(6)A37 methyltransferase TsaA|nr:tRNA (N6-threonylcarbamoyladenosine(37)-N6)-methyltransferase TrmO [Vicinamibacterales bacterium]
MSVKGAHAAAGTLWSIGVIRSVLTERHGAPKQGSEGAPDAWLEVHPSVSDGLLGVSVGDELIVITWLHQGRRDVLQVHPRGNPTNPLTGVFATRSPDRPNPLGLHPVVVREIDGRRLRIGPIEAIDGTPVVDIKPVLC